MIGYQGRAYVHDAGKTNPEGRYQVRCTCTRKFKLADTLRQANELAEYHDALRHPNLGEKNDE